MGKTVPVSAPSEPAVALDEFFVQEVAKYGRRTKKELREDAERAGYFAGGESSGRATHTTLMNIVRAGRLLEIDADMYAPGHKPGEFMLGNGALAS